MQNKNGIYLPLGVDCLCVLEGLQYMLPHYTCVVRMIITPQSVFGACGKWWARSDIARSLHRVHVAFSWFLGQK